jgi:hypothetical protein
MLWSPVKNKRAAIGLRGLPVIAVDLGFSGKKASCGVAFSAFSERPRGSGMQFYRAADRVGQFITEHKASVLILEAPLSASFTSSGNPQPRGEFEHEDQARWWSMSPGAAMALAALFFLRRINHAQANRKHKTHVIEGFLSYNDLRGDSAVAAALRDAFLAPETASWHTVRATGEILSALDLIAPSRRHATPPVILRPINI